MSCLKCFRSFSEEDLQFDRLRCGHHVCSLCIKESPNNCPVCLRKHLVDHVNMDSYPDCAGCFSKRGSVYCATCFCTHCVECDAFFHSKVFTHRHSRSPTPSSTKTNPLQLQCVCHLKPLLYFCKECEMRVCVDCVTADSLSFRTTGRKGGGLDGGEHIGHEYETLVAALATVFRPQLEECLNPLSEQMRIVELLLRNIKLRCSRLQQEEQEATQGLLAAMLQGGATDTDSHPATDTDTDGNRDRDRDRDRTYSNTDHSDGGDGGRDRGGVLTLQTAPLTGEREDISEEHNSRHNVQVTSTVGERGLCQSAMNKIQLEFRNLTRLLHERYLMLAQSVQQEACEKVIKLHHQRHSLHEFHTVLFVLQQDHLLQLQRGRNLEEREREREREGAQPRHTQEKTEAMCDAAATAAMAGEDEKNMMEIAMLVEWTIHSMRKSDSLLQIDILDEIGHLADSSIPLHFSSLSSRLLTHGTVGGPAPPEHLRCRMARHDMLAQTVSLSWTSSEDLIHKRRREAKLRLRKHHSHHHTTLFDPYDEEEVMDDEEEDVEFGSSSSEDSEDSQHSVSSPVGSAESSRHQSHPSLLSECHDEMVNMMYALDTTNLRDLEAIEKEVARAADRPVKTIDHHLVEMRVLRADDRDPDHPDRNPDGNRDRDTDSVIHRPSRQGGGSNSTPTSHSYEPHGGNEQAFLPIAEVAAPHSHLDVNISKYPNSCLQFRIRAASQQGVWGEHSVVLSFCTPRVCSHECRYRAEKGPFESSTGLFYLLGTGFGQHVYHNPFTAGAVQVTASALESGRLRSFVSEGHDGDLVVRPVASSFLSLSLPFLHHHHYDRGHGNAWIEVDISAGYSQKCRGDSPGVTPKGIGQSETLKMQTRREGEREGEGGQGEGEGGVVMLVPEYYCLRSASGEGGKLRSWVLEGCREKPPARAGVKACHSHCHDSTSSTSLSGTDSGGGGGGGEGGEAEVHHSPWVLLSEHKHDTSLAPAHLSTAAWPLALPPLHSNNASLPATATSVTAAASAADSTQYHHAYRYFRIVSTGNNSSGNRNLECSGFELYGRVVLMPREQIDEATYDV